MMRNILYFARPLNILLITAFLHLTTSESFGDNRTVRVSQKPVTEVSHRKSPPEPPQEKPEATEPVAWDTAAHWVQFVHQKAAPSGANRQPAGHALIEQNKTSSPPSVPSQYAKGLPSSNRGNTGFESLSPPGTATVVTLYAGQTIDVGTVAVWNDDVKLYVQYVTISGWFLSETHMAVATSLAGIPQTKNGNPKVGQFPHQMTHNPMVNEYDYIIDLAASGFGVGEELFIAAHAAVNLINREESAWGDGLNFPGNNWAMYFNVNVRDVIAPEVTVVAVPPEVLLGETVLITVTATDNVGVVSTELTVNGTPVTLDPHGQAEVIPTDPGVYEVVATASDAAGNVGMASTSFATSDTEPPVVLVTVVPPQVSPGESVTITVTATDNVGVVSTELTVNGTPVALDPQGQAEVIPTDPGVYEVVATASDAAGNVGTASTNFSAVDNQPPVVSVTAAPPQVYPGEPVTITVTATDNVGVVSIELRVNGELVALNPGNTADYIPAAAGVYQVIAIAEDAAGNQGSGQTSFEALVEPGSLPPSVFVGATPVVSQLGETVNLFVVAEDDEEVVSVSLSVNGQNVPLDPNGMAIYNAPVTGNYTAIATAEDVSGQSASDTIGFKVIPQDTTPPVVTVEATPDSLSPGETVTLAINASDEGGITYQGLAVNGTSLPVNTNNQATFEPVEVGIYQVVGKAYDEAGNLGSDTTAFEVFILDSTPPSIGISALPNRMQVGEPVTITVSVSDENQVVDTVLTIGGNPLPLNPDGTATYMPASIGSFLAVVTATDMAGNQGSGQTTFEAIAPGPDMDLAALSVDLSQVNVDPATSTVSGMISGSLTNAGSNDILEAFAVVFFEDLDCDQSFNPAIDHILGETLMSSGLVAGQTVEATAAIFGDVLFPGNIIYLYVDSGFEINETDETNNQAGSAALCPADLIPARLSYRPLNSDLALRIGNGGAQLVAGGVSVAFYDGDPQAGAPLIGVLQISVDLAPGCFQDLLLNWFSPPVGIHTVYAVADDDGSGTGIVTECNEVNNILSAEIEILPEDLLPPAASLSVSPDTVLIGEPVTLLPTLSDNIGVVDTSLTIDGFEIPITPEGAVFIPSGPGSYFALLTARDAAGNMGTDHKRIVAVVAAVDYDLAAVTVEVLETGGSQSPGNSAGGNAAGSISPSPRVPGHTPLPPQNPSMNPGSSPVFSTTPLLAIKTDEIYHYMAKASDPDGGEIFYYFEQSPWDMTVSLWDCWCSLGLVGSVRWLPTIDDVGSHDIVLVARDEQGEEARQQWTLIVEYQNQRPVVSSVPRRQAVKELLYTYQVEASDYENDPLTYSLLESPQGMGINPFSGLIEWTPTPAQVGSHSVIIAVTDSEGKVGTQDYFAIVLENDPGVFEPGAAFSGNMSAIIVNQGAADIIFPVELTFFEDYDYNRRLDPGDHVLAVTTLESLAAGDTAIVCAATTDSLLFEGNIIYAMVDSRQVVAESDEANNFSHSGMQCQVHPPLGVYEPSVEWELDFPEYLNMNPIILNANDDNNDGVIDESDIPDIVLFLQGSLRLKIFSGDGSGLVAQDVGNPFQGYHGRISELAGGDIDQDGVAEILIVIWNPNLNGFQMLAFDIVGSELHLKWQSPKLGRQADYETMQEDRPISLGDLDGDGSVEIVFINAILDAQGNLLRQLDPYPSMNPYNVYGGATLADLDMDGDLEIILGYAVYHHDGSLYWTTASVYGTPHPGNGVWQHFFSTVVNIDSDEFPEVIVKGPRWNSTTGGTAAFDHDGSVIWVQGDYYSNHVHINAVADFDGDGNIEIIDSDCPGGYYNQEIIWMLDHQGNLQWMKELQYPQDWFCPYKITAFDFEGDGIAELVAKNNKSLAIFSGLDGSMLFNQTVGFAWSVDYYGPPVADVDNDGRAEIVVLHYYATQLTKLRIYGDDQHWVNTRGIWNQSNYHITNVNEDGSIPSPEPYNWQTFNNSLTQAIDPAQIDFGAPDVTASHIQFNQSTQTLTVRVGNGGGNAAPAGLNIAAYEGNPAAGANLIGLAQTAGELPPGQFEDVTVNWAAMVNGSFRVYLAADDDGSGEGQIPECKEENNVDSLQIEVLIGDNIPPTVTVTASPGTVSEGDTVTFQVSAVDNAGVAGARLEVNGTPLNLENGQARFIPPSAGSYTATATAWDFAGNTGSGSTTFMVEPFEDTEPPSAWIRVVHSDTVAIGEEVALAIRAYDNYSWIDKLQVRVETNGLVAEVDHGGSFQIVYVPALPGVHISNLNVTDEAGNIGSAADTFYVTGLIDQTPPVVTVLNVYTASGRILVNEAVHFTVNVTDNVGVESTTIEIENDPREPVVIPGGGVIEYAIAPLQEGPFRVRFTGRDFWGNRGFTTVALVAEATGSTAPWITLTVQPQTVFVNQEVTLRAFASPGIVSLSLDVNGATIPLNAQNSAVVIPEDIGEYTVTLTGADANNQTYTVSDAFNAVAVGTDLIPPEVTITAVPGAVGVNEAVLITVTATDNVGVVSTHLSVDGEPVALDANGQAQVIPVFGGIYTAVASASDAAGNRGSASAEFEVTAPPDETDPVVSIDAPSDLEQISERATVFGSVQDEHLVLWTLEYALYEGVEAIAEDAWTVIGEGTAEMTADSTGVFDATLLMNGAYVIRLTAEDVQHNIAAAEVIVTAIGQLKVGNFTLAFNDLSIPVSGIPITIVRSYDSRDKQTGDFGVGWNMAIKSVDLREAPNRDVTVTLPDGRRVNFFFDLTQQNPVTLRAVWQPEAGVYDKLEMQGDNRVLYDPLSSAVGPFFQRVDIPFECFEIPGYVLTTKDGTRFTIPKEVLGYEDFGETECGIILDLPIYDRPELTEVRDLNGNTLTFTENGIIHSSGKSVTWQRDGQGRIERIVDPRGNDLYYGYDAYGDLASFTDPLGHVTQFVYYANHYLKDIIDPRGVRAIRSEYDDDGRLIATVDANGNRIEIEHNLGDRTEIIRDRLGNPTIFSYDERGNVLAQTDALGHTTTYTYDEDNNMLSETDALGNTTGYTYDSDGNMLTQTDPLGNASSYTYNSRGEVLTITDPSGNTTSNSYDSAGNLTSTIDAMGYAASYSYDGAGNMIASIDPLGHTATYEYDAAGNLTRQVDALGHATTYTYDNNGNQLTQTNTRTTPGGTETITTSYVYDDQNRQTEVIDPLGYSTVTEYNEIGQVAATINKNGVRTEFSYDDRGNQVRVDYADGTYESTAYDAEGRRIAMFDRGGRTTAFEYDAVGQLMKTIFPDGAFTRTEYDEAGRTKKSFDERGNPATFAYDDAGRQTSITNALNFVTAFEYDSSGNRISTTDARGNTTSYEYDKNNRLKKTVFPDGTFTETTYDELGRRIAETDPAGKITHFHYDALGRLTSVTDALGNVTAYGYDELGNMITQTDAQGRTTNFEYDKLGRQTKRILPLGQEEIQTYDPEGNLAAKTDFNGDTIAYEYDPCCNRLKSRSYPDSSTDSFTYTPTGQRETATDSRGVTSYQYDSRDRLLSRSDPDGRTISYTYDEAGNRTSVTVPSGTTTYTFDELNRLETVTDPDNGLTSYTYDAAGNRAGMTYPNGTTAEYSYDTLNRLTFLVNKKSSGEIISSYTYTLGPAGNRIQVVENDGRTVDYTYDDTYKLTGESINDPISGARVIGYSYDAVGNRLTKTDNGVVSNYSYDANDRLLTENGAAYSYDDNGNTISRVSAAENVAYGYDYQNRLIQANINNTSGSSVVDYAYDVDGIRVGKNVDGTEITEYVVDTNRDYAQVLEERDGNDGSLIVDYIYGDDLISQERNGTKNYYHYDGQMSVRKLSDLAEIITDDYVFDAFGILSAQVGTTLNNYLYTGEQYDPNIRFYYLRARYFNSTINRFITLDIWGGNFYEPMSLHKYIYGHVNPVNNVDPSGCFILNEIVIANSIVNILSEIEANVGFAIMDQVRYGGDAGLKSILMGAATIVGLHIAVRVIGKLFRRVKVPPSSLSNKGFSKLIRNKLRDKDLEVAKEVLKWRGGTLEGATIANSPAIDGWWSNLRQPIQLYYGKGTKNYKTVLDKIQHTERVAISTNWNKIPMEHDVYRGIDFYGVIDNIDIKTLTFKLANDTRFQKVLNGIVINNVHLKTMQGWITFVGRRGGL